MNLKVSLYPSLPSFTLPIFFCAVLCQREREQTHHFFFFFFFFFLRELTPSSHCTALVPYSVQLCAAFGGLATAACPTLNYTGNSVGLNLTGYANISSIIANGSSSGGNGTKPSSPSVVPFVSLAGRVSAIDVAEVGGLVTLLVALL